MNRTLAKGGFTLVELILVAGMLALLALSIVVPIGNSYKDWKFGSDRSNVLQDGRAAIEQMVRILRQAKGFSAVTSPTDEAGYITFTDVDGDAKEFRLDTGTSELKYGGPGDLSTFVGPVSKLVFTCYDIDANSLAEPVQVRRIRAVHIEATFVDEQGSSVNFTLSGRVFCPEDFLNEVAINEIMYNPLGKKADSEFEWVELYNSGDSAIDVNGWTIWTSTPSRADQLIAHPQFGSDSTIIPAGGYAVITTGDTDVYTELVTNGGFESRLRTAWQTNNWDRTRWNAHTGNYKLESATSGAAWAYQDITVPSDFNSCLFLFWETTTAAVDQTQMTVTVRDYNDVVLETGYSGQMNSVWTCHTMDLTAYANQGIRIHFSTNKAVAQGVLLLDDVSVATSYVDINAVRLGVGDSKIGNGLENDSDTVAVTDGSRIIDSVAYSSSWGGNGDGTSLSRKDPQGGSNDPTNWESGPINGTPGSAN